MMGKGTLYVAYGSNLNLSQMEARCPGARVLGAGKILGCRLAFKRLGVCAYATIEPCEGEYVPVGVWEISGRNEAALDSYEGVPTHYNKETIEVEMDEGSVRGMVYVMNQRAVPALPGQGYFMGILEGYRSFGLEEGKLFEAWYRAGGDTSMSCGTLRKHS